MTPLISFLAELVLLAMTGVLIVVGFVAAIILLPLITLFVMIDNLSLDLPLTTSIKSR